MVATYLTPTKHHSLQYIHSNHPIQLKSNKFSTFIEPLNRTSSPSHHHLPFHPSSSSHASLFNQPSTHSLLHTAHPHIYSLIQSTHSFLSKRVHSVIVHTFFRMCFACLWVKCLWVHHCLTMGGLSPKENQVQGHCQCLIYCQQPNGPSLIYFNLLKSIHVYAKAW